MSSFARLPLLALLLPFAALAAPVPVLEVSGSIDPGTADYLVEGIRDAERDGAPAVVIRLDTPGGLMTSTREIVAAELGSSVPVLVWVEPSGARAASAGTFITLAAHVAAMAPGTTIGAAHPVALGGQTDEVTNEKLEGDAAAWARSIAEQRGRDVSWAERTVRESAASTDVEALEAGAIDVVATDLDELLRAAHGRTVHTSEGAVRIDLTGAEPVEIAMTTRQRVVHALADPSLVYGLLVLGLLGLWVELHNPGLVLPGLLGLALLVAAGMGLSILPFSAAGVLLVLLGFVLLTAEVWAGGTGLLLVGGLASLAIGGLLLFDAPDNFGVQVATPTLVAVTAAGALVVGLVGLLVARAHRSPVVTGAEGLVGERAEVVQGGEGRGLVRVEGEEWAADWSGRMDTGTPVRIVGIHGLRVDVEPDSTA